MNATTCGKRRDFYEPQIYHDHFQNFKSYNIPRAQLVIADVPYNLGKNAYASNPAWYKNGDNKNGESELAGKMFFESDADFSPAHFMIFCERLLRKEKANESSDAATADAATADAPKAPQTSRRKSTAPCIVLFVPFEQMHYYIDLAQGFGFKHYIPLVFRKPFSAQVLKANMKIVGNCEYGLVLYRDKLPKFNNFGRMIFNCFDWMPDGPEIPRCHPTQKPVRLLKYLIEIFTDRGDVVIDPVAGSGSTLRAAAEIGRRGFGFEIKKDFYEVAKSRMLSEFQQTFNLMINNEEGNTIIDETKEGGAQ